MNAAPPRPGDSLLFPLLAIIPASPRKPHPIPYALMKIKTLTIVGVGLIGGSIGLAAKRRGVAERVLGAGRQQASLDRALALGAIDERRNNEATR